MNLLASFPPPTPEQLRPLVIGFILWVCVAFGLIILWPILRPWRENHLFTRSKLAWLFLVLCRLTVAMVGALGFSFCLLISTMFYDFAWSIAVLAVFLLLVCTWALHYPSPFFHERTGFRQMGLAASLALLPALFIWFGLAQFDSMIVFQTTQMRLLAPGGTGNEVQIFSETAFEDPAASAYAKPAGAALQALPDFPYAEGRRVIFSHAQWTNDGKVFVFWPDPANPKTAKLPPPVLFAYDFDSRTCTQLTAAELPKLASRHGGLQTRDVGDNLPFADATIPWFWQLPKWN